MIHNCMLDSFYPEAMEKAVQGARIHHVQLGRGRFLGHLMSVRAKQYRLDHGAYNLPLHAYGSMPGGKVTLGFIMGGRGAAGLNGHTIERPAVVMLDEGSELDYRLAPHSEWLGLQVDRACLARFGIFPEERAISPYRLPLSAEKQTALSLRQTLASLREVAIQGQVIISPEIYCERLLAGMLDEFLTVLQDDTEADGGDQLQFHQARKLVKNAIDHMNEHYGDMLRIGVMCGTLGTSCKTLERAFLKCYGVRPKQYLGYLRLAKARHLLLRSAMTGQSITDIATACGINHLSRFAQCYRATYGELPSATVGKEQ